MRILFTADIHYGMERMQAGILRFLQNLGKIGRIDAIVIAGDLAEGITDSVIETCRNHREALVLIKQSGVKNIAFCAGSHDIWCSKDGPDSWTILNDILYEIARELGITYLERENMYIGDAAIVGTMAHYDYSMAEEGLIFEGTTVRSKHYRDKTPPGYDAPVWGDALYVHWEYDDPTACKLILANFEKNLVEANQKADSILVASHTVPIADINGHIFKTNLKNRFINAYSGTHHLNEIILRQNKDGKIKEAVSGHTHIKMGPIVKDGIRYRNILSIHSDYPGTKHNHYHTT